MDKPSWIKAFPAPVIVCDRKGVIIDLNEAAIRHYASDGGADLIGKNALDCHPAAARQKLEQMLKSGEKNVYTTEKNGIKKLIYQAPWFENGEYAGFIEIDLEIPMEMAHFVRD